MKANVGGVDRVVRGVAGIALIAAGLLAGLASPWDLVCMGAGVVFTLTALISFCPLYTLLGINSCGSCPE